MLYGGSDVDIVYGYKTGVHGHLPTHACDTDPGTFYLSVGHSRPDVPWAVGFVELWASNEPLRRVFIEPWAGPYTAYLSVSVAGEWQGADRVPYCDLRSGGPPYSVPLGADIPFVRRFGVPADKGLWHEVPNAPVVDRVRVTLAGLVASPWGPFIYRCGIRQLAVA